MYLYIYVCIYTIYRYITIYVCLYACMQICPNMYSVHKCKSVYFDPSAWLVRRTIFGSKEVQLLLCTTEEVQRNDQTYKSSIGYISTRTGLLTWMLTLICERRGVSITICCVLNGVALDSVTLRCVLFAHAAQVQPTRDQRLSEIDGHPALSRYERKTLSVVLPPRH